MTDFDPLAYAQQQANQAPPAFNPLVYAQATAADPSKRVAIVPDQEEGPYNPEADIANAEVGGAEAVAHAASGGAGMLAGGLRYALGGGTGEEVGKFARSMTYEPKTEAGRAVAGGIDTGASYLGQKEGEAAGNWVLDKTGSPLLASAANTAANIPQFLLPKLARLPEAAEEAPAKPISVSDQILAKSREAGYVVPPATTNPSIFNKAVEGIAGKANVAQAASVKNQAITNGLARQALGLPKDAPLTAETLDELRANAGQTYGKIENAGTINVDPQYHADIGALTKTSTKINKDFPSYQSGPQAQIKGLADSLKPANDTMDAGTAVELSKDLRFNANANESVALRTGDPTAKAMARAQRDAAEAVEDQVQRHLTAQGQPELANEWNQARTQIAKSYTVQKALDGAGNVDATKLGKALKNKNYNDELQTAADFANAFPKAARVLPGKESMPGMSPLDVYGSVATSIAAGNPLPMLMGPGRMVARKLALSGQKPPVSEAP